MKSLIEIDSDAVPTDNGSRRYYDKRFAPRMPNAGKRNPEEPIHYSYFRPLVRPFHDGQLLAKRKILSCEGTCLRCEELEMHFAQFPDDYQDCANGLQESFMM